MEIQLGEVIARRKLYVRGDDARKAEVLIGMPQPFPEGTSFYCPFQIRGAGHEKVRYSGGVDSVQAFELCLRHIAIEISLLESDFGVELRWEGSPDDPNCGFLGLKV